MKLYKGPLQTVLIIVGVACLSQAQQIQTSTPRAQLQQYVTQLQAKPSDDALRTKIIQLALTLDPKPATPDDAIRLEGAAEYAFKNAKSNSDLADAAHQYEKALLIAPWLAADYFNCGVAYEKSGDDKAAIRAFNFYLSAAPNATDSTDVKKRIGGLQYALDQAASAEQERQAAVAEAERQRQYQAQLAEERRNLYPFEGIWMGEDNNATNPVVMLGRAGSPIKIWRDGGEYRAAYVDKYGNFASNVYRITVRHDEGNHIVLQIEADGVGPAELDLSTDRRSLTGRIKVQSGTMAHPGKYQWLPAALDRIEQ